MKLSRIAASILAMGICGQSLALELGELSVSSAINEPFKAKVELLGPEALDPSKIRVELSARQAFEPKGQKFTLRVDDISVQSGRRYMTVVGNDAVDSPFVSLSIEIRGLPEGSVSNEYDLLLDDDPANRIPVLPQEGAFDGRTGAVISGDQLKSDEPGAEVYGPISPSDTLWSIGNQLRPNSSVTVHQTMVAIHQKNPNAFVSGDINRMVKGAVLRVPTLAEVEAVDRDEARAFFVSGASKGQTAFRPSSKAPSEFTVTEVPREPAPSQPRVSSPAKVDGNLLQDKLNEQSQRHADEVRRLRDELATSTRNLEEVLTENQQLRSRLSQLTEDIDSLQQQLGDEAKLQAELREVIAEQNRKLSQQASTTGGSGKGSFLDELLNSTWGLITLATIPGLLLLGLLFAWLRRRGGDEAEVQQSSGGSLADRLVNGDRQAVEPEPVAAAAAAAEQEPAEDDSQAEEEEDFAIRLDDDGDLDDWLEQEQQQQDQNLVEAEAMLEHEAPAEQQAEVAEQSDDALDSLLDDADALLSKEEQGAASELPEAAEDIDSLFMDADALLKEESELPSAEKADAAAQDEDFDALLADADALLQGESEAQPEPAAAEEEDFDALLADADALLQEETEAQPEPAAAEEEDFDALLADADTLLQEETEAQPEPAAEEDDFDSLFMSAEAPKEAEPALEEVQAAQAEPAAEEDDFDSLFMSAEAPKEAEPVLEEEQAAQAEPAAEEDDFDSLFMSAETPKEAEPVLEEVQAAQAEPAAEEDDFDSLFMSAEAPKEAEQEQEAQAEPAAEEDDFDSLFMSAETPKEAEQEQEAQAEPAAQEDDFDNLLVAADEPVTTEAQEEGLSEEAAIDKLLGETTAPTIADASQANDSHLGGNILDFDAAHKDKVEQQQSQVAPDDATAMAFEAPQTNMATERQDQFDMPTMEFDGDFGLGTKAEQHDELDALLAEEQPEQAEPEQDLSALTKALVEEEQAEESAGLDSELDAELAGLDLGQGEPQGEENAFELDDSLVALSADDALDDLVKSEQSQPGAEVELDDFDALLAEAEQELASGKEAVKGDFVEIDELLADSDKDLSEEDPYQSWDMDLDMANYQELVKSQGDAEADQSYASKLDLARAYIEIDDLDSARELLNDVQQHGSNDEQADAAKLLARLKG
ncbi:FimV/HubP family polar landmark protein [Gallaecimonas sp. GXIMD4217]|uniref:FimV/HubP family polar landmark protein n=1 Tax=Gallaecimonas sp. GXIMD4217 TaxID=3131927 RepID=UPI00311AFC64